MSIFRNLRNLLRKVTQSNSESSYIPKRALAIVAHPDDPEYFFAGTMALWARNGTQIRYVVCSEGQLGSNRRDPGEDDLGPIRRLEQLDAARHTGVEKTIFLDYEDGFLENSRALQLDLAREIRSFTPDTVVINDPRVYFGENFINHPDHRAVASAALRAIYPLAGSHSLAIDGLAPHSIHKLFISTWLRPNTWIDITSTIQIKIEALQLHRSQLGNYDPSGDIRCAASDCAKYLRMDYAEEFYVISL